MATGEARLNPAFAEWLRQALRLYEARNKTDITQEEVGMRVAKILGRKRPFSVPVVSYWFKGREPRITVGLAIAAVLDADPFELIGMTLRPVLVEPRERAEPGRFAPALTTEERERQSKGKGFRRRRHA